MTKVIKQSKGVALIYHFFAHYRGAVLNELLHNSQHPYLLVGDVKDPTGSGIEEWQPTDPSRFLVAPCRYLLRRFLFQHGLTRLVCRRDIDTCIFLGDYQFLSTWWAAMLARLMGKRVLFWTHGWTRREAGVKDRIRCAFYRLAHGFLLYGNYARGIALEHGFAPDNLYVIYNSLDYPAQCAARSRVTTVQLRQIRSMFFLKPYRPMLICTSRLIRVRRLDIVLEAMAFLKATGCEVNLLLVGDGPERESLEKFAVERGLSVHFFGACYDEETLAGLVMSANVTVAPGKVGLTAMHSLAYGTPVITHNDVNDQMPEWEAIIPGYNGGFFRKEDAGDLARAISEWTKREWPDEQIRHNCYEIIDRYYNPAYQRRVIDSAVSGIPARHTSISETIV